MTTAGRIVCVLALLGVGAPATAQGLGDTAARERSKRTKEKKEQAGTVYTNDDLDAVRPPGEKREEGGSASSSSESGAREGSESESESSSERPPLPDRHAADRPYIDALRQAQSEVSAIEDQIRQANAKLNPMSTDYIYGPSGSNSANDELRVRQELGDLQARLNEARRAVAEANEELQSHRRGRPAGSSEE